MLIEMQLARIIISEINDNQLVFLREVNGERQFPILIGIFEATSIDRRVKGFERPRPLTHDLLVGAIEMMGGELDSVIISEPAHLRGRGSARKSIEFSVVKHRDCGSLCLNWHSWKGVLLSLSDQEIRWLSWSFALPKSSFSNLIKPSLILSPQSNRLQLFFNRFQIPDHSS